MARRKSRGTDLDLAAAWKKAVCHRRARCGVCGGRTRLQGHHVVPQQAVRRFGQDRRFTGPEIQRLLWDPRNGMAVCERCHQKHELAVARIRLGQVPKEAFVFAQELDALVAPREPLLMRIEREYPR